MPLSREERAYNRVFKPRRDPGTALPNPAPQWPHRTMRVTSHGKSGIAVWEQKHGVWFCTAGDSFVSFMYHPYCYTKGRMPSLKREGYTYEWIK